VISSTSDAVKRTSLKAIYTTSFCRRNTWYSIFFCLRNHPHQHLHSFPTRRSSDLRDAPSAGSTKWLVVQFQQLAVVGRRPVQPRDRKSTRLNSSHVSISYAVFCLKKKI